MARYRSGHNGAVLKTVDGDELSVSSNLTRAARSCMQTCKWIEMNLTRAAMPFIFVEFLSG